MKPLRTRLGRINRETGIQIGVLEKDYALSWVLAGISEMEVLRKALVFKGGTALKKCYFGEYRFSEDLDFSALEGLPRENDLESLVRQACELGMARAREYSPIEAQCERYVEKDPHPGGQEAFKIQTKFPWHRQPLTSVYVEIAVDEPILDESRELPVFHGYEELLSARILTYSLKEIVLEKMRGILQYKATLEKRGWAKSRARDFYDLWRILRDYSDKVDKTGMVEQFLKKCEVRNIVFSGPEQFFEKAILDHARENWEKSLRDLVPGELPPFDDVLRNLRIKLRSVFADA